MLQEGVVNVICRCDRGENNRERANAQMSSIELFNEHSNFVTSHANSHCHLNSVTKIDYLKLEEKMTVYILTFSVEGMSRFSLRVREKAIWRLQTKRCIVGNWGAMLNGSSSKMKGVFHTYLCMIKWEQERKFMNSEFFYFPLKCPPPSK